MENKKNLIPLNERTKSEQREICRKGGLASGKVRQEKKRMRENLRLILNMETKNPDYLDILKDIGLEETSKTNEFVLLASLFIEAVSGNVRAFELIRDTIGEKPTEEIAVTSSPINIINDLNIEHEENNTEEKEEENKTEQKKKKTKK